MPVKPVLSNVKSPQYLSIGDGAFHSGCAVLEVTFAQSEPLANLSKVIFVNNYTAFVTLKIKSQGKSGSKNSGWITVIRDRALMKNPHSEGGSQSYFSLHADDFSRRASRVIALRFILKQPSPNWRNFSIEEIYVYADDKSAAPISAVPKWLTSSSDDLHAGLAAGDAKPSDVARNKGLPDPDAVAARAQQVWLLAEKAADAQPRTAIGRFDVDGSYEVNLLIYS